MAQMAYVNILAYMLPFWVTGKDVPVNNLHDCMEERMIPPFYAFFHIETHFSHDYCTASIQNICKVHFRFLFFPRISSCVQARTQKPGNRSSQVPA